MNRTIKLTWIRLILIALGIVLAVSFIGRATDGFSKDIKDMSIRTRNPDNLLSGEFEDYNAGDGITVTAKKDGTLILNGEYKGSESSVVIPVETVTLSAGTYTISGAPNGGNYTYHLRVKYGETTVISDYGASGGEFTLTASTSVAVELVVFGDNEFKNVKIQPVLVVGTEAGDFYK